MAKVTTIPATISRFTATPINERKKRRTAAYARVSTDSEEQLTSYSAQVDYYTNYIKSRDDWEFVSVYTDEGITGTNTKHREGFKRMVADALAGKIDLIVTKSVSRFARNTVDSLTTVRQLKEKGVEIYFEKENIWTLDSKGELLITIMSSLAQEESRSISENCTWGQRKRFADGKVTVPFKRFLGYDRGPDGNLVLNKDEAVIIRRIYSMFLQGMTPHGIAARLTADGIKSPGGKDKWNAGAVRSILTNEKYKGDALLQKSYTVDFLTKKKKVNEGEIPQYYVEGNHEAIISPEVFEMVQQEMERRSKRGRRSGVHLFSGKIRCGECGSWYGSKTWHSNDKYKKIIWQCNHKFDGDHKCTTPHLTNEDIHRYFISAVNQLLAQKDTIIASLTGGLALAFDLTPLQAQETALIEEVQMLADAVEKCIYENAHVALDQTEYQKRYDGLVHRYDEAKVKLGAITEQIADKKARRGTIEEFLKVLREQDGLVTDFQTNLWCGLVDFMTVYSADDVRITFKNGAEIKA